MGPTWASRKSTKVLSHAEWAAIAPSTGPGVGPPVLGGPERGRRAPVLEWGSRAGPARVGARISHLRSAVDEKLCVGVRKATAST